MESTQPRRLAHPARPARQPRRAALARAPSPPKLAAAAEAVFRSVATPDATATLLQMTFAQVAPGPILVEPRPRFGQAAAALEPSSDARLAATGLHDVDLG